MEPGDTVPAPRNSEFLTFPTDFLDFFWRDFKPQQLLLGGFKIQLVCQNAVPMGTTFCQTTVVWSLQKVVVSRLDFRRCSSLILVFKEFEDPSDLGEWPTGKNSTVLLSCLLSLGSANCYFALWTCSRGRGGHSRLSLLTSSHLKKQIFTGTGTNS